MGGTGVASAHYGSGVLINPALLAKAKPDDDITLIEQIFKDMITAHAPCTKRLHSRHRPVLILSLDLVLACPRSPDRVII